MSSSIKNIEISNVGATIEMLTINTVKPNAPECYALSGVKSVIPTYNLNYGRSGIDTNTTYPFLDQLIITVNFDNEHANPPIRFDIQTVSNQSGWTPDFTGLTQAVNDICGWITASSGSGGPAGSTEATLLSVLNAIIASDQDIEILLVRDTGDSNKVLQQITNYETGVPVVTYKDVNGVVVVPVGPLEYLDPSAVLNLMLADTNVLATPVIGVATGLLRVTSAGASTVAAGKRTVSFFNAGNADCSVNGAILERGESITYPELSNRDVYGAIPYDALTSELTITTVG